MEQSAPAPTEPARPSDEEILKYERALKEAETASSPLVSDLLGFEGLEAEYAGGLPIFVEKIRASRALLLEVGYDEYAIEDFFECFFDTLKKQHDPRKLLETFQTEYVSDTVVCYLRLLTAAVLKKHKMMFEAFIMDSYPSMETFISSQVEPMNVESDEIHIVAMANALGVNVRVANLDASQTTTGTENYHDISPFDSLPLSESEDQPKICLLFRPGHYDILYPK
ncbi:hypothetical protein HK102_009267 [Quaeritorhiza haematococci]|nr:hypothetical protein HK102_009267 [Quaeritorhiza haematococci]